MTEETTEGLSIPPAIQAVIDAFDARADSYDVGDVSIALNAERAKLGPGLSKPEHYGAWSELLAFGVAGPHNFDEQKGTHFGPNGSGERADGVTVYFPDPRQADVEVLAHWKRRARSVKAPVLVARYADLVWDLAPLLGEARRDPEFVRLAIDAYCKIAADPTRDAHDAFPDAERALELAIQTRDDARRDAAKEVVLALHKQQMAGPRGKRMFAAWDIFAKYSKVGLTDSERTGLVADLEAVLIGASDTDPTKFNPYDVEDAATRLAQHYHKTGGGPNVAQAGVAIAKAFEHFGSLANPQLAAIVLQTSMDAYQRAGLSVDAERVLKKISEKNLESIAGMTKFEHTVQLPHDQVEAFLRSVVLETPEETLATIAAEFLVARGQVEADLQKLKKTAPLSALIPRTKLSGDRTVAEIGSVDDDPTGRMVDEANQTLRRWSPFLVWAMGRAREVHKLSADHITILANRTGLFGDGKFLAEGVAAWLEDDHVKAVHVLIPQIEAAFRNLAVRRGRPKTKSVRGTSARLVVTMSDLVSDEETARVLGQNGPDFVLHMRALYADQRGWNLRNDMAHGLMASEIANATTSLWIVHLLLLLGGWPNADCEAAG